MPHIMIRESDEYRCTVCCKRWGVDEDEPVCLEVKPVKGLPEHIAIIGFLAAKLSCYEPDSPQIARAMKYLERECWK